MFVRANAVREAQTGKAAIARRAALSQQSVAEQEPDAAVAPPRFVWSFRDVLLSPPAGLPNSDGAGKPGNARHLGILPLTMQAKLEVGAVDDPLELEADRAAALVMHMPVPEPAPYPGATSGVSPKVHAANPSASGHAPSLKRKCACGGTCEHCKAELSDSEDGKVQRKIQPANSPPVIKAAPAIVHGVISEHGDPLDTATRAFFEPRFEWDFSRVRVHSGARADESARAVHARAYTVGNHIVFRNDEFNRGDTQGRALIAHELAHVIQQETSSSAAFAEPGSGAGPQSNVVRRQPANQPDEPLDVALARQDLLERIAETTRKIREGLDEARVDNTASEARVAPFYVQEDPQVQRMQQQIASGRTKVPERVAKLHDTLRIVAKEALKESDDLGQLRTQIAIMDVRKHFIPALLFDLKEYESLLKKQKGAEQDYAETIAFFEKARKEIEITKQFLPKRAEYLRQRAQYLEEQARSAADTAKVGPDTRASADQLTLLRTVIEASPTLRPYLKEERARGSQPKDLRDARKFIIESSDSDLQDEARTCHQGEAGPGKKIGGFYCRNTDTIHLPPDAKFGTALHEAIHKYSRLQLRGMCGQFLNEGLTQYFADVVLKDQNLPKFTGHAYQDQLKCATRFVDNTFSLDEAATLYFLGLAAVGPGRLHQFLHTGQCLRFCAREQGSATD